ncbi:MAG: FemAB family PEP-CTERM system-associated protein [Planctomycetes bacterium]|nr:FemAB family PEP-CTERM system-associated protein [Planctomycetota bacterium]
MNIRLATTEDRNSWDQYIISHPDASPYHLFAWKLAVEEAYQHEGFYLIAEDEGQTKGVLPLLLLKPPFLSGQLVSLPFCDIGSSLCDHYEVHEDLINESILLARKVKAKKIDLRCGSTGTNLPDKALSESTQTNKVSMLLKLPSSSEKLWESFKSKLRSQVRKAEKNGLQFVWATSERLNDFYQIFSRNMKELGSPVHSKEWFKCIMRHYGENSRLGLVYHGSKPVGGGITLSINRKICIPWASTLKTHNRLSPNMQLYWNILKYSADSEYSQIDFGRSTPGEGTYKFKMQWGANPTPLYWNHIATNGTELKSDSHSSSKREKVEQIWQKIPLPLANYIGPSIRKHISL